MMEIVADYDMKVGKPSFFWLVTEAGRALTEYGASLPYTTFYKPEEVGDGHPVLVLPGFMASEKSTQILRKFISKLGYHAVDWGLGRNYGKEDFYYSLIEDIEKLYESSGQKVSLIGWSLGGIYARQLAKENPNLIRQVITLGSPFGDIKSPNYAHWLYKLVSGKKVEDIDFEMLEDLHLPPPVPTTSIYTKEDGVVNWKLCMDQEETSIHQNIQVRGSHLGLGVNPIVLKIIADRLQHSEENWEHFKSGGKMEDIFLYPDT